MDRTAAAAAAAAMHSAELNQQALGRDDLRLMQALEMSGGQIDPSMVQALLSGQGGSSVEHNQMQAALLQMLAQQEQEQQLAAAALNARPEEHYLTIAQNGR